MTAHDNDNVAVIRHFPPPSWSPTAGTRARRRALRRIAFWHAQALAGLQRLDAPPVEVQSLDAIAARLRALVPY